jgi:IS66 C-terminal element
MIHLPASVRVYLCLTPCDMRKSFDSLHALVRGNWTFFGSDTGGKTAAVLRSFIASCKRSSIEPFAWFRDVLSRIPAHSITPG